MRPVGRVIERWKAKQKNVRTYGQRIENDASRQVLRQTSGDRVPCIYSQSVNEREGLIWDVRSHLTNILISGLASRKSRW